MIHCPPALRVLSTVLALLSSMCTYKYLHVHAHMRPHTLFTSISSVCSSTFSFHLSSLQQWLKSWMYWHVSSHHPTTCEEDRGEFRWESVCWGVKDPLSPKPSPVHPTESPDGVIQPSWSLANSYSHKHMQLHTLKALEERVTDILSASLKSPQWGCTGGEAQRRGVEG